MTENELPGEHRVISANNTVGGGLAARRVISANNNTVGERLRGDGADA